MKKSNFKSPPSVLNPQGKERKVGYEFEFTGISMELASEIIQSIYGGEIQQESTYKYSVNQTSFGSFRLELDAQLLRDKKYSLKEMASSVVPFEIITPPIQLSKMNELNKLVDELRAHKAKGTGSSFIYAFGLHLNPEVPDISAHSILNHLRAYVLLAHWIRKESKINISRQITPFINEYEEDYIIHILNPDYKPNLNQLIKDYFRFDNSRNRPLDLLPLLMFLDEELTSSLITDKITSSRPTYHYRLPNCSLEDQSWSLAQEWNRWVLVEKLASDKKSLNQYSRAYLKMKRETLIRFDSKWIKLMDRWVRYVWE
ncbi:MAG: hypothetical protein GVY20_03150 [Bacteroidetes bacterium]|jgi:hypothetical protein|nr:hypothetical protein [Bacteroidota bacterium]